MTKRLTIALLALAVFVMLAVLPVSAQTANATIIKAGESVYIGEAGLDITGTLSGSTLIAWFPSTAQVEATTPEKIIDTAPTAANFFVNPNDFGSRSGNWYCWTAGQFLGNSAIAFYAYDPSIRLAIWDLDQNRDVTGKNVVQGTRLTFRIDTNGYGVAQRQAILKPWPQTVVGGSPDGWWWNRTMYGLNPWKGSIYAADPLNVGVSSNRTQEGFVDIKVKTTEGSTLIALLNASTLDPLSQNVPLTGMFVNNQPWFWGNATARTAVSGGVSTAPAGNSTNWMWATAAQLDNLQLAYPAGTYTVTAEFNLNSMKDNYKDGTADYAGKTISEAKTVTLVSDTVKIEANKDSVVRSNPFSITVTGRPNQIYYLWVKGTSSLNGFAVNDMPPYIVPNQAGIAMDNGTFDPVWSIGVEYTPQNLNRLLCQDVPFNRNWTYYGRIITNENGVRTIEWMTSNWTKAQTYNIRVENQTPGVRDFRTDEVSVKVEKGAVTITASGDGSYYLGEEVKFSGTNTESKKTYLFIVGPNLNANGSNIDSLDPRLAANAATFNDPTTFKVVDVLGDNTWSWKWGTATVALDAGTYTVYAVSAPNPRTFLADVAYGTVSIIIKKPFVSATVSQSTLAKGDKLYIRGTAEGKPAQGVALWVLGKNFVRYWTTSVESDASFEFDQLDEGTTAPLAAGQYFVVVQHPMQNDQFDIVPTAQAANGDQWVRNLQLTNTIVGGTSNIFKIQGQSSLQGSDAAEALVQGINDPNVDDTYTKLQFLVEEPVINIDTIGDRHVGDKFTITAKTNLAVDDEVLFEVYSSSFKPTQKSQSGEFSGSTGTVKVTKGDTGMNKLAFDVDASTFKPDEYIVTASAVIQQVTGTALFNVLEGVPQTVAPTTAATSAAPTTAATTAAPTTAATTKAPTQPGFGALVALIGLGAVAFLVVRRH